MKTIKVIDLLNKIANGEEVPKKIKIWGYTFLRYEDKTSGIYYYATEDENDELMEILDGTNELNDELEIIEEDKEIEKLDTKKTTDFGAEYVRGNRNKINELVDAVNELKKEGN